MTDILSAIALLVGFVTDNVVTVLDLIVTSPILMLVVGVSVTGAVFGFGGRLLGLGKRI